MSMAGSSVNYMMHGARGFAVLSEMVDHIDAFGLVYSDLHDVVRWFDKLGVG
mgnify:FL=1